MERSHAAQRAAGAATDIDVNDIARNLTEQYQMRLSTNRLNALNSRHLQRSDRSPTPGPQSPNARAPSSQATSLRNLPVVPEPPTDTRSTRFRATLRTLSEVPMRWENPGLLDEALQEIPLDDIYKSAEEESNILQAEAESLGRTPAYGYQDCVIKALMRWFRKSFFTWINNPPCEQCASPTICVGVAAVSHEERAHSVTTTELYQCSHCGSHVRFPRYNDAFVLLQPGKRRGRVGEWTNCFGMLCRAVGSRVRWVWNAEDHVWLEVYSVNRQKWIHVDAVEGLWDKPLTYTGPGWNKKMSYCIAFSVDGATDVTRRYVRDPSKHGAPRKKAPESVLIHILDEIRALRRQNMPKQEKFRLQGEDMAETKELENYMVTSLATSLMALTMDAVLHGRSSQEARAEAEAEKARETQAERARSRARGPQNHQHNPQEPPR